MFKCNYCDQEFTLNTNKIRHVKKSCKSINNPKNNELNNELNNNDILEDLKSIIKNYEQYILKYSNTINKKSKENIENKENIKNIKNVPKSIKDNTWDRYVGDIYSINCLCCNYNIIKSNNFHCAHVIPHSKGGKTIVENLRPVCSTCNLSMGQNNLFEWCEKYYPNAPVFNKNEYVNIKMNM